MACSWRSPSPPLLTQKRSEGGPAPILVNPYNRNHRHEQRTGCNNCREFATRNVPLPQSATLTRERCLHTHASFSATLTQRFELTIENGKRSLSPPKTASRLCTSLLSALLQVKANSSRTSKSARREQTDHARSPEHRSARSGQLRHWWHTWQANASCFILHSIKQWQSPPPLSSAPASPPSRSCG